MGVTQKKGKRNNQTSDTVSMFGFTFFLNFIVLEIFAFQNRTCSVLLTDDLTVLCTGVVGIPVDFS